MKIGDSVGAIYKCTINGVEQWKLRESKVNKIVENRNSRKYHTKDKFYPLDADDVDMNTRLQQEAKGQYIMTNEVFELNDTTRPLAENWVSWANENMDKAVSIFNR